MQVSGDVLQRIFDASPDALLVADGDGTIVLASRRAEDVLGTRRAELVGAPVDRFVRSGPDGGSTAGTARWADGTEHRVEVHTRTIDADQGHLVATTIRPLVPAAPAPALRTAAHELNNLLSVISNYSILAVRGTDDPAVIADLEQVQVATARAALLVREVFGPGSDDGSSGGTARGADASDLLPGEDR